MAKTLDLTRTVHDLVSDYPELKDVMVQIGFTDIAKPMALNTVGRVMTIPKGCAIKDLDLTEVVAKLEEAGFSVTEKGAGDDAAAEDDSAATTAEATEGNDAAAATEAAAGTNQAAASGDAPDAILAADDVSREELLKQYVRRLNQGEDLESVRKDFAAHFEHVDASEIMAAEQALIDEGTPIDDVTRLCDVHSTLFHGATRDEIDGTSTMTSNMEAAVAAAFAGKAKGELPDKDKAQAAQDSQPARGDQTTQKEDKAAADNPANLHAQAEEGVTTAAQLAAIPGHPLQVLVAENDAIAERLAAARAALEAKELDRAKEELTVLRQISRHYSKKGDLLMPLLATRYGITGPSNVMWTVDVEIREEIARLVGMPTSPEWTRDAEAVVTRADEMIYKEANILFPLCAANFSDEEWAQMREDMSAYDPCLIDGYPTWQDGPAIPTTSDKAPTSDGRIQLPTGSFTPAELQALLATIPGEITFVDVNDTNAYFNEGEKDFKRPSMALGRKVYSCHPPKVEAIVRGLIDDFKSGTQSSLEVWHKKAGRDVLVRYLAVRDAKGAYLGTLEFVQDLTSVRKHFEETD